MTCLSHLIHRRLFRDSCTLLPLLVLGLALIDSPASLRAQSATTVDDQSGYDALMNVLDEETEDATRERLNADFLPGILTVLKGDDLEKLGIRDAWESLDLVPGIHTAYNNFGEKTVEARGLGYQQHFSFNKVFIDGVAAESTGEQRMAYLSIPVAQIERIEVMRGSGGVIFGADATAGVINIITRKEGNSVWAERGAFNTWSGGGRYAYKDTKHDLLAYASASIYSTDGSGAQVGNDVFHLTQNAGLSPGPIDDRDEVRFYTAGVQWQGLSLEGRYVERLPGDFFGFPGTARRGYYPRGSDKFWHLSALYEKEVAENLTATTRVTYKQHDFKGNGHLIIPAGAFLPSPPGQPQPKPAIEDSADLRAQRESRWEASTEWVWTGLEDHRIMAHAEVANLHLDDAYIITLSPVSQQKKSYGWLPIGRERNTYGLTVQDQWTLVESLLVTGGIRLEYVDRLGTEWAPQIALAWRVYDPLILKAQFSKCYRNPSMLEINESSNNVPRSIDSESVDNAELCAIYQVSGLISRLTFFNHRFSGLIERVQLGKGVVSYTNGEAVETRGVELELEYKFTDWLKTVANGSFNDTRDDNTHRAVEGSTSWLANLALTVTPVKFLETSIRWRYVGDTINTVHSSNNLVRADVPAYNYTDVVLNFSQLPIKDLTLQFGVKNVFNQSASYASLQYTMTDGLPAHQRQWFTQVTWDF
ncbi:MAG: TonB-dependent receptor [Verrucomicrobiota bacterium]|nr:TonB-dependent receptor [Verrucomicrobiota bacterium]